MRTVELLFATVRARSKICSIFSVLADHVPQLVLLLELFPQKQVFLDELVVVHDLPDRQGDVVGVERFDEIVVAPFFIALTAVSTVA